MAIIRQCPPAPAPSRGPQFGLRSLLWAVAVLGVLFAVGKWLGAMWSVLLAWLALLIFAHVAGNSFSRTVGRQRGPDDAKHDPPPQRPTGPLLFAPLSPLQQAARLGKSTIFTSFTGAVLGSLAGALFLWTAQANVKPADFVVAVLSGAVLGGLFAFLSGSFLSVTALALFEACWPSKDRLTASRRRRIETRIDRRRRLAVKRVEQLNPNS